MSAKRRLRKKKSNAALFAFALLLVVVCFYAWRWLSDNKIPNFNRDAVIYVRAETTVADVLTSLMRDAGVRRPGSLERVFRQKKVNDYLTPGRYEIKKTYSGVYVARMLNNGWQSPCKLVLSGMMRRKGQIASKISAQMMVDSATVAKALEDKLLLARFGFSPSSVFSLFIPDTYQMYWTDDMEDILSKQKKAWDAFWTDERKAKAKAQGLTPKQASILASIVAGETNYQPEMSKVAGVYLNRLHKGMKLQADPTVAYCLDYKTRRILKKDLLIDSPYNTYKYAGLPPGPICVPSKACLEAVLSPEGDYLYFCANATMDGSHLFAKTYSEHCRNARAFQSMLNKKK